MLFQLGKYVRDTVGNLVRTIPQYTTICAQQHLKQIYSELESTEKNLGEMNLEIRPNFKDELIKLIDEIQINMAYDGLLLSVHGCNFRLEIKPSLVAEIFIILKT